jgi:pimeloyl-ACP methyl ester carboxylesterase
MYAKLKTAAIAASIIGAGVLAIALISGLLYEQVQRARDRERLPQIGHSVDIGGRMLNIYCSGTGQPTVIFERGAPWTFSNPKEMFENGAPRPGYGWVSIQRELAKTTKACWYDRAGSGWSDLGPYPRDSASQARDLHALLQGAGAAPPYVLVAESSAAMDAHVYAGLYPADVAGLVFVNGVHPDLLIDTRPGGGRIERLPGFVGHSQDAMAQVFNQIGLYRLVPNRPAPAPPKGMMSSEWDVIWRLTQSSKARSALMQDIASWAQSAAEARAAGSLGDRPLIVLSAENTALTSEYRRVWMELQTDLVRLSARGKHVVINESTGELIYQAPDAVVEAARQMVSDVRQQPGGMR